VAIARALVNNPEVIFADEPTGNLDSKSGFQVMKILQELNEKGNTIILVTHERNTAEHAERIITLRDGVIIDDSPVTNRQYYTNENQELKK
jgi:putative ABC transport system ATP-binding protein